MTISNIFGWLTTAGDNDDLNGIPLDPNLMFPSHVNDAFQEAMRQVAGWRDVLSFPTAGGPANALTLTPTPAITAYATSQVVTFLALLSNTATAVDLNVSGLGNKRVRKVVAGTPQALDIGDILIDHRYVVVYDAAGDAGNGAWMLINPQTVETAQVHFPATQVASADANTLDDYQEGTWTPTLTTNGTDFSTVTYDALTAGTYTKIGRVVYIIGRLRTDAVTTGAATGGVQIGGLPFASSAAPTAPITVGSCLGWLGEEPIVAETSPSTTKLNLLFRTAVTGSTAPTEIADVGTGANSNDINVAGFYFV